MLNRLTGFRKVSRLVLLVVGIFALLFPAGFVSGSAYASLLNQPRATVSSAPVALQGGAAGTNLIYTNGTSAKVSAAAPAPTPTYNATSYSIIKGTYVSGTVPTSIRTADNEYFVVRSAGSANSTTAYNPSGCNLVGSTTLVSGAVSDLVSNDGAYMTFRSYDSATSSQSLYAHQETTTIGGLAYNLSRISSADTAQKDITADGSAIQRILMDKSVYQLMGVSSVPASTWTIYYRARCTSNVLNVHCDADILIRMSNGTVRSTRATHVAISPAMWSSWATHSGTYSWTAYTVVAQTDYLEIDYYFDVTKVKSGEYAYLGIEGDTLNAADQTHVANIMLPSQYTSEVEFTGSSNIQTWNKLVRTIDSAWNTSSVTVTIQVYNYTLGGYPTSGNGYESYTSSVTPNTDETKTQTMATNPTHFRNATGYWKIKIKGVKTTTTCFNFKADWVEFKPSYYNEYSVSTEFLFSSMTKNTPTQLSFTVVSEYDVASVSVTVQVWNYSSSAYVTSGQGYQTYTSGGSNETKLFSITTTPQSCTSIGNARIKITGILSTTTQYQQKTNQIKLVYSYNSSPNYNYVLKVVNQVSDSWKIRLRAYSQSNIARLNNCTVYFHNATDGTSGQIYIISGSYTQQTGPWYELPSSPAERYIALALDASSSEVSHVYVYLDILVPDKTTYAQYILTFEIT